MDSGLGLWSLIWAIATSFYFAVRAAVLAAAHRYESLSYVPQRCHANRSISGPNDPSSCRRVGSIEKMCCLILARLTGVAMIVYQQK